jgi:hypothetical protein
MTSPLRVSDAVDLVPADASVVLACGAAASDPRLQPLLRRNPQRLLLDEAAGHPLVVNACLSLAIRAPIEQHLAALRFRLAPGGVWVAQVDAHPDPAHPGETLASRIARISAAVAAIGWTVLDAVSPPGDATVATLRAVAAPAAPAPCFIAALGLRRQAGVTEARVDYPLRTLATRPGVRALWSAGPLDLPQDFGPGILILHRQFLESPALIAHVERLAAKGWLLVSEFDDNPDHWVQFARSRYRGFRGVHAVTTTTAHLAEKLSVWNPHVAVFPNAIFELPPASALLRDPAAPLRVFFGALNRLADWAEVEASLLAALPALAGRVEFVVVHDAAIHARIAAAAPARFLPTLDHAAYMEALSTCDVALMPLADTPFNRAKSDLKLIEACAAGAVPICSDVVYGVDPAHRDVAFFPGAPAAWGDALRRAVEDRAGLVALRARGLAHVARFRMHAGQVAAREAWYRSLLSARERLEAQRQARLAALAAEGAP